MSLFDRLARVARGKVLVWTKGPSEASADEAVLAKLEAARPAPATETKRPPPTVAERPRPLPDPAEHPVPRSDLLGEAPRDATAPPKKTL